VKKVELREGSSKLIYAQTGLMLAASVDDEQVRAHSEIKVLWSLRLMSVFNRLSRSWLRSRVRPR
jgi:hypothetical protein